jgi:hypothetical protein
MLNAIYNSRSLSNMRIPSSRLLRTVAILWIGSLLAHPAALAEDWKTPAAQLAQRVVSSTGPAAVALEVVNRSSLGKIEVDSITAALRSQLEALGTRFVTQDAAAATVQISLSEDLHSYVWVAAIHQAAGESSVAMVSIALARTMMTAPETSSVVIRKTLLWTQPERILDVAIMEGTPTHMAVLEPDRVALYKQQYGRWQPGQMLQILHARPWPRDLRGRLALRKDHLFDAYLPGVFCRSTAVAPLTLNCFESDDPWPLGSGQVALGAFFTSSRNYFTGALTPGVAGQTSTPSFYSAAAFPRDKYTLWLFEAVDGQVHVLDGVGDRVVAKLPWGSDIVSVNSGCGSGWNILAAASGDSATDSVRAFDLADREAVPVSAAIDFAGPITAMWTETNANNAIAVSRDSQTGDYEAFRLTVACGK